MFVKDVFPDMPLLANFEFYYHSNGVDVGFDPEFVSVFQDPSRLRVRNATNLLAFEAADWGHSATRWQRSLYPPEMRSRISALHEGVDTGCARPNPRRHLQIAGTGAVLDAARRSRHLCRAQPRAVSRISYVHARAAAAAAPPQTRASRDRRAATASSYGAPPPPRSTFKEMMLQELGAKLDLTRVHFVGMLEYHDYLNLLQVSSVHVYLTYPFVLSWSFIEAMACGCLIVGSRTPPVLEVLRDGINGLTVDFFRPKSLANRIEAALEQPAADAGAAQRRSPHRREAFRLEKCCCRVGSALFR